MQALNGRPTQAVTPAPAESLLRTSLTKPAEGWCPSDTDLHDVRMGHKEGWARIVNAPPRVQPERLTARKYSALSPCGEGAVRQAAT